MTTNIIAENIKENRYIATAQLTADDFTRQEWKQYRTCCRNIVANAENIRKGNECLEFDASVCALFALFGVSDASKGLFKYRTRIAFASLKLDKKKSEAYKKAEKTRREKKMALTEAIDKIEEGITPETNPVLFAEAEIAQQEYDSAVQVVEELSALPHNCEWIVKPLLSKDGKELAIARKHIEDTIADIFMEREAMTDRDFAIEQGQLEGGREVRRELDKENK